MNILTIVAALVLALTYPEPNLTPGDISPGVTTTQICTPGYTASVRNVPFALRQQVLRA